MNNTLNALGKIVIGSVVYYNNKKCVVGQINSSTATLYDYVTMTEVCKISINTKAE